MMRKWEKRKRKRVHYRSADSFLSPLQRELLRSMCSLLLHQILMQMRAFSHSHENSWNARKYFSKWQNLNCKCAMFHRVHINPSGHQRALCIYTQIKNKQNSRITIFTILISVQTKHTHKKDIYEKQFNSLCISHHFGFCINNNRRRRILFSHILKFSLCAARAHHQGEDIRIWYIFYLSGNNVFLLECSCRWWTDNFSVPWKNIQTHLKKNERYANTE